jgi:hypothetical protein
MAVASPSVAAQTQILIGPGLSPLEGARIDVAIDDLLAEFTLTQRFRNDSAIQEAVFTFPSGRVFLNLSATLGERELEGRVVEKQQANREYEEAIAAGDSAILVERTHNGMLTANIGNLRPGETISVRLKFAEWLAFNGNDVRFRMPTAIAPRYGTPAMSPRDQPVTDLLAQYQFAAEVRVRGLLSKSQLASPSHLLVIGQDGVVLHEVRVDGSRLLARCAIRRCRSLQRRPTGIRTATSCRSRSLRISMAQTKSWKSHWSSTAAAQWAARRLSKPAAR